MANTLFRSVVAGTTRPLGDPPVRAKHNLFIITPFDTHVFWLQTCSSVVIAIRD